MLEFTRLQKREDNIIREIGFRLEEIYDETTDNNTKVQLQELADELDKVFDELIEDVMRSEEIYL